MSVIHKKDIARIKKLGQLLVSAGIQVRFKWRDRISIPCVPWNTKRHNFPSLNQSFPSCSVNYRVCTVPSIVSSITCFDCNPGGFCLNIIGCVAIGQNVIWCSFANYIGWQVLVTDNGLRYETEGCIHSISATVGNSTLSAGSARLLNPATISSQIRMYSAALPTTLAETVRGFPPSLQANEKVQPYHLFQSPQLMYIITLYHTLHHVFAFSAIFSLHVGRTRM
jgi:hypothetical protein